MSKLQSIEDLATIRQRRLAPGAEMAVHCHRSSPLLGGGAWLFSNRNEDGHRQKTDTSPKPARTGRISLIVTAAGNLAPTNQIIVGSELSGTAKEVLVDTNDQVKKGQHSRQARHLQARPADRAQPRRPARRQGQGQPGRGHPGGKQSRARPPGGTPRNQRRQNPLARHHGNLARHRCPRRSGSGKRPGRCRRSGGGSPLL